MYAGKIIILVLLLHSFSFCSSLSISEYLQIRKNAIVNEKESYFGANLKLEGDEIAANKCLMSAKFHEINKGYKNALVFWPSRNFLNVREEIESSKVFKIIKLMPKGASLHTHSAAAVSSDFLHKNLTFMPNLYICLNGTDIRFWFFQTPNNNCDWQLFKDVRTRDSHIDLKIKEYLALPTTQSTSEYNSARIWEKFEKKFHCYQRNNFIQYFYQVMQELYDDHVLYVELRFWGYYLYDLHGTSYNQVDVIQIFKQTVEGFIKDHPDFIGAKIIFSPSKSFTQERLDQEVRTFREIKSAYPGLVIGFYLVGEEDKMNPLLTIAEKLLELSNETTFYLHAGETNWFGHNVDENLFDAVLLNSKRIGHGLALLKHPKLMKMVKEKHIAIELSPISNQVLGYVDDMRNHPASYYFAKNLTIVVTNDDPTFWGASGLSYDFYETFMGIMSRDADLRALKQLAINSILYSGMNSDEQQKAMNIWKSSWSTFIKYMAHEYNCN